MGSFFISLFFCRFIHGAVRQAVGAGFRIKGHAGIVLPQPFTPGGKAWFTAAPPFLKSFLEVISLIRVPGNQIVTDFL